MIGSPAAGPPEIPGIFVLFGVMSLFRNPSRIALSFNT